MKFIICVVLVLSLVSTSLGAMAVGYYKNPKYPGKCYISEDLILPAGEHNDPNADCGRIICSNRGFAEHQTCGRQILNKKGFKYGDYEDISLPYPVCCKREIVPV